MRYMWYKGKVASLPEEFGNKAVEFFVEAVDSGRMKDLPDTAPLNEDMRSHPNEVHIIVRREDIER
jgi:hypothetical protein